MTEERKKQLEENNGELTKEEIDAGWHFCFDWDYMLINHYCSPEICCCYDSFVNKYADEKEDLEESALELIRGFVIGDDMSLDDFMAGARDIALKLEKLEARTYAKQDR